MSLIVENTGKLALKEIGAKLYSAYQQRQVNRVNLFFSFINLVLDSLKVHDAEKLNEHIETEEGMELLASFAESITTSPSPRRASRCSPEI